jgi:N-terminal domain of unknown function (DUF4140)
MKFIPIFCCAILMASPAWCDVTKITLYLDGAHVEREVAVEKGHAEVQLPGGMSAGSLRIKPLRGGELVRVDVVPAVPDRKLSHELFRLAERSDELNDRLKALDVREEIFRAAAKAQSGKTPRKTKSTREPLEELRKGTEFAIVQLEGVYRARRKTGGELKSVTAHIAALRNSGSGTGSIAKVRVSGKNSRILVSYFTTSLKWAPSYDFRVGAGVVEISVNARYPQIEKGAAVSVVPALHVESSTISALPLRTGGPAPVTTFRFPITKELFTQLPETSLVFTFRNSSGNSLPPGEASCYRNGEYLGSLPFSGSKPDETLELDCGRVSRTDGQQDLQSSS